MEETKIKYSKESYMFRIAIVEDNDDDRNNLLSKIKQYEEEFGVKFDIVTFNNGFNFMDKFIPVFNLVFLDINMPGINGMDAAGQIRKVDEEVAICFTTSLGQYAIKGYEVSAIDFILKPVEYKRVKNVISKTYKGFQNDAENQILIKTSNSFSMVSLDDIEYVTADDHIIIYHTANKDYESWDTLKNVETKLYNPRFYRLSRSVILNLDYTKGVSRAGDVIMKDGTLFQIPRGKKTSFIQAVSDYHNF